MKIPRFPEHGGNHRQKHSPRQHLRSRAHHLRTWHRHHLRQRRRNRPAHRRHNQRHRPHPVYRRPAQIQRPAYQHPHSAQSNQQRYHQPHSKSLRPQNKNFPERHENRNRRQHHRRQPRRHALLRPEHQPVIPPKNQKRHQRYRRPLPATRPALSPSPRPAIKCHSRNQESHRRQQKRRHLSHPNPDRIKRRSPNKINNPKRHQRLPRRPMCRGIHNVSVVKDYHAHRHPASHHSTNPRIVNSAVTNTGTKRKKVVTKF